MTDYEIRPVDKRNLDGENGATALPMDYPTGLSLKASAALRYLDGAIAFFRYQGKIIATDESGWLTCYGTGIPGDPAGGPFAEFESESEIEPWLTQVAEDLGDCWNY